MLRIAKMKRILIVIAGGLLFTPFYSYSAPNMAENISDNVDRISILEDQISLLEKEFNSQLKISGYADVEYKISSKQSEKNGFRLHHFSLFFKKQINEQWRFFSEIEYEDAPKIEFKDSTTNCDDCSGEIFVEAVNIDYEWSTKSAIRFGRFFTPAGIWSIDHYPPFVATQKRPLHIRKLFPQLVDGIDLFGTIPFGGSFMSYDLYFGNGEGNTGNKDENSKKATGLNLDFNFPVLTHTQIGTTFYQDTLNDDTEKSVSGFHTKIQAGGFTLQAEYAKSELTPITGAAFDSTGYYGQISYNYVKWLAGYRYDYLEENSTKAVDGADLRNVYFVNYRIDKDIVIKLEHIENESEINASKAADSGTHFTIVSVAIYLGD